MKCIKQNDERCFFIAYFYDFIFTINQFLSLYIAIAQVESNQTAGDYYKSSLAHSKIW